MNRKTVIAASLLLLTSACSQTVETRGNFIDNDRLAKISQGTSTRMDVMQNWGTPTTVDPFDEKKWFYIGEKVELKPFTRYNLLDRRIVSLEFDDSGVISSVKTLNKDDAVDVAVTDKATPTAGKKLNAVQQMIGNMGKFNSEQMSTK